MGCPHKKRKYIRILLTTLIPIVIIVSLWLSTHKLIQRYKSIIQDRNTTIESLLDEVKNECSELYSHAKNLEQKNKALKERVRDLESKIITSAD